VVLSSFLIKPNLLMLSTLMLLIMKSVLLLQICMRTPKMESSGHFGRGMAPRRRRKRSPERSILMLILSKKIRKRKMKKRKKKRRRKRKKRKRKKMKKLPSPPLRRIESAEPMKRLNLDRLLSRLSRNISPRSTNILSDTWLHQDTLRSKCLILVPKKSLKLFWPR